ncbi:hypothetical protein BP00DRAFT_476622 [Aspergillus indologenus CBS 114.80]|uniref:Uncharacterized protein n=1 Tax=Aspergillus indologenus CBS 114.80 TaxID=1450541 RepID=A0A2V5I1D1_9EURO|nr:hypothetical protein BP00DRAFT_476622 [Aspergillus indologenus CBS 114.80]
MLRNCVTQAGMSREFETDLARRFAHLLVCRMARILILVARNLTQDRERFKSRVSAKHQILLTCFRSTTNFLRSRNVGGCV